MDPKETKLLRSFVRNQGTIPAQIKSEQKKSQRKDADENNNQNLTDFRTY